MRQIEGSEGVPGLVPWIPDPWLLVALDLILISNSLHKDIEDNIV